MDLPSYVQMEPVGQCNLRCQMCAIQFRQDGPPYGPPALMSFETFTRLLDQFPGLQELHLQGLGEPMMHPRLFDMIEQAAARGIRVSINSNLTLVTPRRAQRCVASGLDQLHVSIDGATAQTYERIRVQARFSRVLESLASLSRTRRELASSRPRLRLITVAMRQNLHELADLVRLAARWEIPEMFVQHLCHDFGESSLPGHYRPMRDFVQSQTLLQEDPARIERCFAQARQAALETGVELRLPRTRPRPHPPGTPGPARCDWPWRGAYISYQGYAMPCCMISTPDRLHFGNMAEQGAAATWNNPAYEAFRAQLASEEPPELCRSCAVYNGTF